MKSLLWILLLVLNVAAAASLSAPTLDMLVADVLSGDDGPRQARARQLLPIRGPEAAWKMLPLLDDPSPAVSFTAMRILEDVIHETGFRGGMEEQARVANAVFALVVPSASDRQKEAGLRLLPYVASEAHPLDVLAALLREEAWREPARACLEHVHTRNALGALCQGLGAADEPFKIALLRSIATFEPGGEAAGLMPLLETGSPAVQAAALRALARTGDPALTPHARRICAGVSPESAFDAWDGWLRLADAMAARGGCWEPAMRTYREILETAPHTLIQGGAIAGLGRYGDAAGVPVIAQVLAREGGAVLEPAAMEAFRSLAGREARLALAALYPEAGTTMKVALLGLFGDQYAPEYAGLLAEGAHHEDAGIRSAARGALERTASPEAVEVFRAILEEAYVQGQEWNPELEDALGQLRSLARKLRQAGDGNGAGRAWLVVYRSAREDTVRREALDGIRANPVPEAFDVVLDLLAAGDLDSLPADAMVGIAQNAIASGRAEEGRKLMDEIMVKLTTSEAVNAAVGVMRGRGPNPGFARAIGAVTRWHFVGPFPWNISEGFSPVFIGEPDISLDGAYTVGEKALHWQAAESADAGGLFDLFGVIGTVEQSVAFAYARIETAEGGPAKILAGSDDGLRVWVNGAVVLENDVDRGYALDQDSADVTLQAGVNTLLAQITQRAGGWAFGLRLTRPDGAPFPFTLVP